MVHREFQTVILAAGRGSRMTDLISGMPKCLLPVGGKPIICHTIDMLLKAGFLDVTIIVLENELSEIHQSLVLNKVRINYELVALPSDCDDWGTADSIRHFMSHEKIKSDMLIVSCDLFTNCDINKLLKIYRQHAASFAALFFLPPKSDPFEVPGTKAKYKTEKDIVGIDLVTNRLMVLASLSDFEENIFISSNVVFRHPKLNLRIDLTDGHLYLLSSKLFEYLVAEKSFSTLKGEFLPYIVSKQHTRKTIGNEDSSIVNDALIKKTLSEYVRETKIEENINELSGYNDHFGDLKTAYHGDILRCYAVIGDESDFGIRINSLPSLCLANWLCIDKSELVGLDLIGTRVNATAVIESTQIDSFSFIGPNCQVKEKTSIKGSVLGTGCIVLPKTRISRCIILQNVEIEDGCILENCIIANNAKVRSNAELKNCIVGPAFCVPMGTKGNRQVLTTSESLMEI